MHQKLAILDVPGVSEPEPAIIEVLVALVGGDSATVRMDAFTAQKLIGKLETLLASGSGSAPLRDTRE